MQARRAGGTKGKGKSRAIRAETPSRHRGRLDVAHIQQAVRSQQPAQVRQRYAAGVVVQVDEQVPAEDHIIGLFAGQEIGRDQVAVQESDGGPDLVGDGILVARTAAIALAQ